MPDVIEPMQALLAADVPAHDERYGFELKWDGIRAIGSWDGRRLRLMTRNQNEVTARYPELWPLRERLGTRRVVLDGEVVAFDERGRPSFEELQQRMHLTVDSEIRRQMQSTPVAYVLFDLLYVDDRVLMGEAYAERRRLLAGLGLAGPNWQTPAHQVGDGAVLLRAARATGLEGVIAKRLDSFYEPGRRSGAWLKIKNRLRQEFVIGGWVDGAGRRTGVPGAILVGYYEQGRLVYASRVGTGFTDASLRHLAGRMLPLTRATSPFEVGVPPGRPHFIEPLLVAEVEFSEWTRGRELRAPSFKGLREDKDPRDVVREGAADSAESDR
jgi:bifunctional non-homologous end joining protein LigD